MLTYLKHINRCAAFIKTVQFEASMFSMTIYFSVFTIFLVNSGN